MNKSKEIVKLENIWAGYDGVPALEDVNLSIEGNDFLGIIGPNGGGKTTLLKIILGLIQPSRGKITVFGKHPKEARKEIGYVPQTRNFPRDFPASVWEVTLMGRLNHSRIFSSYCDKDKQIAEEKLKIVGLKDLMHRPVGELSEGQKQRAFIARALASEPKLLLLDEPTASLDTYIQQGIYEILKNLKKNMAIVLVSHDIGVISSHVDKIACLNRRLFYHHTKEINIKDLEAAYQCPVEIIAHGIPHRVMKKH